MKIIDTTPCALGDQAAAFFPFFFGIRIICFFEWSPEQVIGPSSLAMASQPASEFISAVNLTSTG